MRWSYRVPRELLRGYTEGLDDVAWVFALLGGVALVAAWRHPRVTILAWIALLVGAGVVFHGAHGAIVAIDAGAVPDAYERAVLLSRYHSRVLNAPLWCAVVAAPSVVLSLLLAVRGRWAWRGELAVVPVVAAIPFVWEVFGARNPAADTPPWRAGFYLLGGLVLARAPDDRRALAASAWGLAVVFGELATLALAQLFGRFHDPAPTAALMAAPAALAHHDARLVLFSALLAFVPLLRASGARGVPLLCAGLLAVLLCDVGLLWRHVLWTFPG